MSGNGRYFISDACAFASSWATAGAATLGLIGMDAGDEANALGTLATKMTSFIVVKSAFHYNSLRDIAKSTLISSVLKSGLALSSHYILLKNGWLSDETSWIAAYAGAGIVSTAVRWGMDYNAGLIFSERKNAGLEQVVRDDIV
ncbi:hypothetical protein CO038_02790 [Candidatus Pacearchaeota archaeon CG_4_9_14_0_2_um_filter_39_13]|nr:hypothetical protein [Candidatus Pacearchaeota archaeon]OIO42869.1 MAG: hypothetical protein AUJ64_03465 [Candidatus Pacearchaeota archaeon CG1_02_39_14]PJC44614.1 MAG: hypothetical protein CO038_02790 [Candidatus Pacearchaeota archaeon CG_4_9_14_0_2_um_filter_39_13]